MTSRRTGRWRLASALAVSLLVSSPAFAQTSGRLEVTVVDQTGGVLPAAQVTVTREEAAAERTFSAPVPATDRGIATFEGLAEGRYVIEARFPGFETVTVRNVRVRAGEETRRRLTLPLERLDESVAVARDSQSSGLDPRGDAFSTILTRDQIDALPDDPEELAAVLQAMAPPGATIRVDGFTGGRLPPKSQIRSIRVPRLDSFAAQNHGGLNGMSFIDIATQPGAGPFRLGTDFTLRDDALTARNPFVGTKGDEHLYRYGFNTGGTIVAGKSSFSLGGMITRQEDTANIFAALEDGSTLAENVRRPINGANIDVRFDQSIGEAHGVRASYHLSSNDREGLGVGGYSLPEHGYSTSNTQHTLRLSESGPVGGRVFTESRLQLSWQDQTSTSTTEQPTIQVLDAFTSGGAQRRGGRSVHSFELATDLDYVRGSHSMRAGLLLEGARYDSDEASNYLGTYTFASLEDFLEDRPRTYSRRTGDPNVGFSNLQFGLYAQDDWRVARSLLLSYGVRYETQSLMPGRPNFSPRFTASWSPFRAGHTTVRASAGYFYDWLDTGTYEQALRVDGFRQQELQILNPPYPDPGDEGLVPPTNRYLLDPDRSYPTSFSLSTGVDRNFGQSARLSVAYTWRDSRDLLAGHDINAPVDGLRFDPRFANVVEARSIGQSRAHSVNVGGSLTLLEGRRTLLFANYTWAKAESNTAGAFAIPAFDDLALEWGPNAPTHRMNASITTQILSDLSLSLNMIGTSGAPYNVTTGFDTNGDGVFNERPDGTSRNSERAAAQLFVNGRVTWSIGFGGPAAGGGGGFGGGPRMVAIGAGGGDVPMMGGLGGGASDSRFRVDLYASVQNLFNRPNYVGYSGVMTSPFFGTPTSVLNPRRVEIGVRFGL